MQALTRAVSILYLVFITLLLLTADPTRLTGLGSRLPWLLARLMPTAHLLSFMVLAFLSLCARWPAPRWSVVLMLALYGGMTEIVQGFVPPRTPEWADWFQDLAGIALGAAAWWAAAMLAAALAARPTDDWETAVTLASPSTAKRPQGD
jgi:VanZ family protein